MNNELTYKPTCQEKLANGTTNGRHRFDSYRKECAECPLRKSCIHGKSPFRRVTRDEAENVRSELRQRMPTQKAKEAYDRRMQCERPFASIKHLMGVTQFLHRRLEKVKHEWHWAVSAFNLQCLISIRGARVGPP